MVVLCHNNPSTGHGRAAADPVVRRPFTRCTRSTGGHAAQLTPDRRGAATGGRGGVGRIVGPTWVTNLCERVAFCLSWGLGSDGGSRRPTCAARARGVRFTPPPPRDALEGKGPHRRPQKRFDRRLEEVAEAVGGGSCRLQMPLSLALGVRETVAGHRLDALEEGGYLPPFQCIPAPPPPAPKSVNAVGSRSDSAFRFSHQIPAFFMTGPL